MKKILFIYFCLSIFITPVIADRIITPNNLVYTCHINKIKDDMVIFSFENKNYSLQFFKILGIEFSPGTLVKLDFLDNNYGLKKIRCYLESFTADKKGQLFKLNYNFKKYLIDKSQVRNIEKIKPGETLEYDDIYYDENNLKNEYIEKPEIFFIQKYGTEKKIETGLKKLPDIKPPEEFDFDIPGYIDKMNLFLAEKIVPTYKNIYNFMGPDDTAKYLSHITDEKYMHISQENIIKELFFIPSKYRNNLISVFLKPEMFTNDVFNNKQSLQVKSKNYVLCHTQYDNMPSNLKIMMSSDLYNTIKSVPANQELMFFGRDLFLKNIDDDVFLIYTYLDKNMLSFLKSIKR